MQIRATSLSGWGRWDSCDALIIAVLFCYKHSVVLLKHILSVNETKIPQHLYCSRSIPATLRGSNYSRLGRLLSGIVLPPIHHRYRFTTSRCSGLLWFISLSKGVYDLMPIFTGLHRVTRLPLFVRITAPVQIDRSGLREYRFSLYSPGIRIWYSYGNTKFGITHRAANLYTCNSIRYEYMLMRLPFMLPCRAP